MGSIDDIPNGHVQPVDSEEGGTYGVEAPNGIPPSSAHNNGAYMENSTRKLRVVTIGAGYSGLTFAHKLQHVYNKEMETLMDHVIYEAKDQPGVSCYAIHPSTVCLTDIAQGTWVDNTYPGVMCDVPSCIYVGVLISRILYSQLTLLGISIRPESGLVVLLFQR